MERRRVEILDDGSIIHCEDCLDTMKALPNVDYVIFSPADLANDMEGITNYDEYWAFMKKAFTELARLSDIVTLIMTDRKMDGEIVQKHTEAIKIFKDLGWKHKHHKIWVKSFKSNLFCLNYNHIMTFVSPKHKMPKSAFKLPDVFHFERKQAQDKSSNFYYPIELPKTLIEAYTNKGDIVYDPFIGSGTTALACRELGRKCYGSEIVPEIYDECLENLK